MLILSQYRECVVNVDNLCSITIYPVNVKETGKETEKKFRILAWFGSAEEDCWGIGDYETNDRAKEVLAEIWKKYGEYLHRPGGPAILRGSSEIPEAFWVLPKVYEMPEV